VQSAIAVIANFRDYARHHCIRRGINPQVVDDAINASRPLQIIIDLCNTEKHVELTHRPRSGMRPKLIDLHQAGRITAQPGQEVWHTWNPVTGKHSSNDPNSISRVVEGTVTDEHGIVIGSLQELLRLSVDAWEQLLPRLR